VIIKPGRYRHPRGDLVVVESVDDSDVRGYTEGDFRLSGPGPFCVGRSVFLRWACVPEPADPRQAKLFG